MEAHPVPGILSKKGAYARIMEWSMKDPAFKAQLFRFVDVLPSLGSSSEIVRHLQEYLGDKAVELSPAMKTGLAAAAFAPASSPAREGQRDLDGRAVRRRGHARRPGEALRSNAAAGIATTIDLLGETVVSASEADAFLQRNMDVLDTVGKAIRKDAASPASATWGPKGPLPRLNLSVKVSALTPEVHQADPESSIEALKERLRPILRRAREIGAFINFDMESYGLKDLTLSLFRSILSEDEFREQPAASASRCRRTCATASGPEGADRLGAEGEAPDRRPPREGRLLGLRDDPRRPARLAGPRLVREARERRQLREALAPPPRERRRHGPRVRLAQRALVRPRDRAGRGLGVDPKAYEFQALYGMADELKAALVASGHRVREYCPVGDLLPGMAYLVRRLLENTSNEGFLRAKDVGGASREVLLQNPVELLHQRPRRRRRPRRSATPRTPTSRSRPTAPACARPGIRRKGLGKKHPIVIGGRKISDRELVASTNPARPSQVVGHWARATVADADAVVAARKAWPAWAATPAHERASILDKAAELMEARRFELNALEVYEAGKPWIEADGDISEAVDFCRYYAAEMRELGRPRVTQAVPASATSRCGHPAASASRSRPGTSRSRSSAA
jgi:RHH-type proline utilization regulon transcriptional repressor/proline dehydrogenase/delta 1-pyrroline-5-carboxylate dehydrogenase